LAVEPVVIDGSRGEGGGQILRTSLALSLITGTPLHMMQIRANRSKPGLQRQHAACVHAAAQLSGATVTGGEVGSNELRFAPGTSWAEDLTIDIGTAGSTTLVIQTILVPAIASGRPLRARITGGTHNPFAPPFEFLDRVFLPHLRAMGADVTLTLEKHGMMPHGGGVILVEVRPGKLHPVDIVEAPGVAHSRAIAIVAGLARHIGDRELEVACEEMPDPVCQLVELAHGPHNVFMCEAELANGYRELVIAHGEKGKPAERVALEAIDELHAWVESEVPVGEHLADQLLLPLAVAGGGRYRTGPLSLHATTNIDTIGAFVDLPIRVDGDTVALG
jgi:RNA 3'-terminal phosphate cyclase (ATP)